MTVLLILRFPGEGGEFEVTGKSERLAKVFLPGLAFCTSVQCTPLSVVY